jgi:hypothetical protein
MAYEPGKVGQAFSFNGGSSRLSVPDNASLKLTSLTIEAWINVRGNSGFILFRGDNRPGFDAYVLNMSESGQLLFQVQSLTTAVLIAAPIAFNEWKHVAATLDDATGDMKLYIDGALMAQTNTPVRPLLDLDPQYDPALGIGNHGGTFHQFPFTGLIDEIALYSRALTQPEIQAIFLSGAAGKCPLQPSRGVPQITSFSPAQATAGSSVTISGVNFSSVAGENAVYFGPVRGSVTAATATALTVSVPAGATYSPISVTVKGLTAVSRQLFLPVFDGSGGDISASTFAPRFDVPTSNGPIHVVAADLDTDGRPDLVVANAYAHVITLYQNLTPPGAAVSPASFSAPVSFAVGAGQDNPYRLAVADVDVDGKLDLLVPDRNANLLYVFRNEHGSGPLTTASFAAPVMFPIGADVRDTTVGDLDGDGLPEIIMSAYDAGTVFILPHGAPGALSASSFEAGFELPAQAGTYAVAVTDLDGDGRMDVAALNSDAASLSVFHNLGGQGKLGPASFAPRVDVAAGAGAITLAVGDLDGDAKNDLVACSYRAEVLSLYRNVSVPGTLDTSSFAARVDLPASGWAHTAALGDFNGDGKPDLALVTELPSHFSVFQNRTTDQINAENIGPRIDFGTGWNAWGLAVGDLDADGRPDVVFGNAYDASLSIYRNVANPEGAPVIQAQPTNQVVNAGEDATFRVSATGTPPLNYQWRWNDEDIPEAVSDTLTLTKVQTTQAGRYSVRVSNALGTVVSSDALLTVNAAITRLRVATVRGVLPDTIVRMPVQLTAVGTENALGFSLSWNTSQVSLVEFVLDPGLAQASVFLNTNNAAIGRLGLLVGLGPGATFVAGTQELGTLVLRVPVEIAPVNMPGSALLFTDAPVMRQVSDAAGLPLPAEFINGGVYVLPNGLEGDITPRPQGDRKLTATDWVVLGRLAAQLESPANAAEFQRADCAPRETLGNGEISVADWVQAGRYAAGLDRTQLAGGPAEPKTAGSAAIPTRPPIAYGPSLRTLSVSDTLAAPGKVVTVPIILESQGDENALGFSVAFDPGALEFAEAGIGTGSGTAVLNVNASDAVMGRLGFALALPAGSKFTQGSVETVKVTFKVSPLASGTSRVDLVGTPVKLQTCGPDAGILPTTYFAGQVTVDPRPPLRVEGAASEVVLRWPAWASNYVLQASGGVVSGTGTTAWTNVIEVPVVNDGEVSVSLPVQGAHTFYRLYSGQSVP